MESAVVERGTVLTRELARAVTNLIRDYRPQCIILFGGFAAGVCRENSDLDLCILKETPAPFLQRMDEARRAAACPVALDVVVYTPAEWRELNRQGDWFVREEILKKGRVLHGDLP